MIFFLVSSRPRRPTPAPWRDTHLKEIDGRIKAALAGHRRHDAGPSAGVARADRQDAQGVVASERTVGCFQGCSGEQGESCIAVRILGLPLVGYEHQLGVGWLCKKFKADPIMDIQLGRVIAGADGSPTVHYELRLKDGEIFKGDLPFHWDSERKLWIGWEGLDWHLQKKKP